MNFDARRLLRLGGVFVLWMAIFYAVYVFAAPGYRAFLVKSSNTVMSSFGRLVVIKIIDDGEKDSIDRLDFVGWKINYYVDQRRSVGQAFSLNTNSLKGMYLSLVLLPALILSTPIRWWDRLKLLGWGLLILTVCNIVIIVIFAHLRGYYSVRIPPEQRTFMWQMGAYVWGVFKLFFGVQAQLLSVTIWGLLCWRYLFGSKEAIESATAPALPASDGEDQQSSLSAEPQPAASRARARDARKPSAAGAGKTGGAQPSRNAPCACGSGKKYKHCCGR